MKVAEKFTVKEIYILTLNKPYKRTCSAKYFNEQTEAHYASNLESYAYYMQRMQDWNEMHEYGYLPCVGEDNHCDCPDCWEAAEIAFMCEHEDDYEN